MKIAIRHLSIAAAVSATLAATAATAEPEAGVSEGRPGPWRVSVGYRAAPGIKTSAGIDAGAAARAAGLLPRPRAGGGAGTSSRSVSSSTEDLGTTKSGNSEADARAAAEYSEGTTRYEFDNGFVDLDDGTGAEGDTMNWQFQASAFADGTITAKKDYSETAISRTRTTETITTQTAGGSSSSFSEWYADGLSGSSKETGQGAEIRLDRTIWDNGRFGMDFGIGWAWYDEVDCYSIRGRAYSAKSTVRSGGSGTATTSTKTTDTTTTTESGSVVTKIDAEELIEELSDVPADGTIGAAYYYNGEDPTMSDDPGAAPVLGVGPESFSTEIVRNPTKTSTTSTTQTSTGGSSTKAGGAGKSSSRSRVVDVRSDGTLSLQEVRCGFQPYWRATDWLAFRADLGMIATYSEIETRTELFVDGKSAAVVEREETDWTFAGYAGLGVSVALGKHVELFAGAEARFPNERLHFNDGIASGKIDLAKWSATAGVCVRF